MWGIGWEKRPDRPIKPRFSLYRRKGMVEEDAFKALKEIIVGWFAFLDEAYCHFVPRLTDAGILLGMSLDARRRVDFSVLMKYEAPGHTPL
jgi:hypothetical protein